MKRKTNVNAIIGFGLSIGAYFTNIGYVLFLIGGLIFSIIGLSQIKERGEKGKAFAIIGIVLCALGFITLFLAGILEDNMYY